MSTGSKSALAVSLLAIVAILMVTQTDVLKRQDGWQPTESGVMVISTRGQFSEGQLVEGQDAYSYAIERSDLVTGQTLAQAEDIIVVIHGFNNSPEKASVKFRTARLSLESAGFEGTVCGFSWDANTQKDPFGTTGYRKGRRHAVGNGRKLGRFIADIHAQDPGARIHLLGYSMGARLALETLVALDEDPELSTLDLTVAGVHLVGAAVDNEEVELHERYGAAIERRTGILVNYYSPEDNALGMFYPLKEADRALGETDIEHPQDAPDNYISVDVTGELHSYGSDRQPEEEVGDNHSGCLGNLSPDGELLDDGIMDRVLEQIRLQEQ